MWKCNSLRKIPNENEYLFISDIEFDKIGENIDSNKLYFEFNRFYKCKVCKRLYFYDDKTNNYKIYKLESDY